MRKLSRTSSISALIKQNKKFEIIISDILFKQFSRHDFFIFSCQNMDDASVSLNNSIIANVFKTVFFK